MEKNNHSNDANFDILFYQSPQPMLIFDIDSLKILEVNEAAIAQYGYSKDEFLMLTTRELRVSEERGAFDTLIPKFKDHTNVYAEGQHLLKSGNVVDVHIVSYVIEFRQKKCRLAHIHNVTTVVRQSKKLETLLSIGKAVSEDLELQSVLQKVVNSITQLIGAEFGICFYKNANSVNPQDELVSAWFAESGKAREILENGFSLRGDIPEEIIRVDNLRESTWYKKASTAIKYQGGEPISIASYMLIPVFSKSKEIKGCLIFGHNATGIFTEEAEKIAVGVTVQTTVALENAALFEALVVANAEKSELLRKATEQNFKKDEFLSIASHELKTPVTSMKGYLQILEKQIKKENNTSFQDLISRANKQVNKIVHLVSELLNLSKLESGKLEYNFSYFNVSEVINDCITAIKNSGIRHNIRVFGNQDYLVYGDRNRIEQVIVNLTENAIKYSSDANEVLIGLSADRGFFKMEIRDFGPGITEEKLQLIFDRYYRGEENSYKTSGLGLGLYISSEIIKRHDGRIGVESEHGKGSTFWFVLPMQKG